MGIFNMGTLKTLVIALVAIAVVSRVEPIRKIIAP